MIDARGAIPTDADHLLPQVRQMLTLAKERRMKLVQSDYCFISYPKANEILERLEYIYSKPKTGRPLGIVLNGPGNNGKSSILRRFVKNHINDTFGSPSGGGDPHLEILTAPANSGKSSIIREFIKRHPSYDVPDFRVTPVVYTQVLVSSGVGKLLGSILKNFYAHWDVGSIEQRARRVYNVCSTCGVRLIVIDEAQRLLLGRERRETLNLIVGLSTDLQIPIVLAGVEETLDVLADDRQASSRFPKMELPPWEDGPDWRDMLAKLEATIPLAHPSRLYDDEIAREILRLSQAIDGQYPPRPGILGNSIMLVREAAVKAIGDGSEAITKNHLTAVAREYSWAKPRQA